MRWVLFLFFVNQSLAADLRYIETSIELKASDAPVLKAHVRKPKSAPRRKLPVLLVFGGFQEAAKVLDLVHTNEPVILASFDYPFDPPRQFSIPESFGHAPAVKKMIRQTHDGIQSLVSSLMHMPEVDSERITILGASLGAPFAVEAAARNSKIHGLVLIHGFGRLVDTAELQLRRSFSRKFGFLAAPFAWLVAHLAELYIAPSAPEKMAERLHPEQQVLFIAAENDSFVPKIAIESLWDGILKSRARSKRLNMPGDHLQPGAEKQIEVLVDQVTQWMKSADLLF